MERLEAALAQYDIHDDLEPEDEDLVRDAAVVEFKESFEKKFLGPSSGTTMTRLVMRLAKQVLGVKSISDVISADRIRHISERATEEEKNPTSKTSPEPIPLVSSYAETTLPGRSLCEHLLRLYNIKGVLNHLLPSCKGVSLTNVVQSMYPMFHEPSLPHLFEEVYNGTPDPAKNFIVRMIVAIGLQRLETKWAGVADSYYLGALTYFEDVVRAMNLQTLQCCVLIGQYSLLTPTRTAAWYIVGLGVRLAQQLGLAEERTIVLNESGFRASALEEDLRRRAFWAIATMDYGLAHSLGRPAAMATDQKHFDVKEILKVDDDYIAHAGVAKDAPLSVRKWIAIHFYNMRLLQLEIRRKLYLKKRDRPNSDSDEWFQYMEKKLDDWKNATPSDDAGSGFSEGWFKGRYYTMIIFLFRPSPQVSRPSARAAWLCYEASEWNIHEQREQLRTRSVELTWAFTQSIFMAVNTILWSLSYIEVRQRRTKEEVDGHLKAAIEALVFASERWPGVGSAVELYEALSHAILQVFDREPGDIAISHASPYADSDRGKSATPSPALGHIHIPITSLTQVQSPDSQTQFRVPFPPTVSSNDGSIHPPSSPGPLVSPSSMSSGSNATANAFHAHFANQASSPSSLAPPPAQFTQLPTTYAQLSNWQFSPTSAAGGSHTSSVNGVWPDFEDESTWNDWAGFEDGMDQEQQNKLLQDLEHGGGVDQIETVIQNSNQFWRQMSREGSQTTSGMI